MKMYWKTCASVYACIAFLFKKKRKKQSNCFYTTIKTLFVNAKKPQSHGDSLFEVKQKYRMKKAIAAV